MVLLSTVSLLLCHYINCHLDKCIHKLLYIMYIDYLYYRIIIDGSGSRTVFNGPIPLYDALYSKANNFITGKISHE